MFSSIAKIKSTQAPGYVDRNSIGIRDSDDHHPGPVLHPDLHHLVPCRPGVRLLPFWPDTVIDNLKGEKKNENEVAMGNRR
jgi:hypothetical protein